MSAFDASLTDFDNWLLSPHQGTISLQIVQQIFTQLELRISPPPKSEGKRRSKSQIIASICLVVLLSKGRKT